MVTMLKNKCSVWKRIKFPTIWYNCYYFTWSDTYFIQLETLLINHPSYIYIYINFFIFGCNTYSSFNFTVVSLVFHIVPAIIETFFMSWGEHFYTLFISVHMMCCQPSFHKPRDHLSIHGREDFASVLETWQSLGDRFPCYGQYECRYINCEIIHQVNLLTDPRVITDW